MQVLHRKGEEGDKPAASPDAGLDTLVQPAPEENIIADDELEIRASHITAAAVAAASVTAAVVTEAAAAEARLESAPSAAPVSTQEAPVLPEAVAPVVGYQAFPAAVPLPQPQRQPQLQPQPETAAPASRPAPHEVAGSARAAWPVSLLTLVAIGLALWWTSQASWPQRGLKPMAPELPSLRKAAPAPAAAAPAAVVIDEPAEQMPVRDAIAILQQESEEKAHLLAQKRATAEARHRREDAAQALREQRRREAEAQLAAARAKAERSQAAIPEPDVVEVAPPSVGEQVQQCSALSLFGRESCLWKLCNGKWGKDGCPAYERSASGA